MQHERWLLLERLFAESVALPGAARDAFLTRACGDDVDLHREIDELLRSHDAPGVLDATPLSHEPATWQPSLAADTCLGSWRIHQLIGRGGMGEVYAATRADGAFEQRAALKLLRYEAVGEMQRFHAERRILARMEHPGIARLLDGGTTPDGRPFTVMEFVEGRSLTDYCREHRYSLQQRLELFAQVCDAVAFAHRNLVIHRDLKPDNILVDADGAVKLLDFGIAKLMDAAVLPRDADVTVAPFTPDYAAPEQLSGEPVTTATDIYALGILLFELLTGERPLRTRGLPSTQALKLLMDRSAPAPSRIALSNTDAPVPARALVGDLDAIVAKCLRKEASHRYETVNALKRDVERHLRNEPVLAREGAQLYVLGRLVRRYRWAVAGVAALIVVLAAGLAGTIWQARRAETQARTSAAVGGFLSDVFRANSSSQDDPVKARQTSARELLDLGAKKIETTMSDAPAAKVSVLRLLGELYDDLALDDDAVKLRRQAVDLSRTVSGSDSTQTAAALVDLAGSMHSSNAVSERQKVLDEAVAILDRLGDSSSETRGVLLEKLAEHYASIDAPRALEYGRDAVRVFESRPPSTDLAEALFARALIELKTGMIREAAASLTRAIDVSQTVEGPRNPSLPRFYASLSDVEYRLQDVAGAERNGRLALSTAQAVNGEDHVDTLQTEMRLGRFLFDTGRTQEGMALVANAKQLALKIRGVNDSFHTPMALVEHGYEQTRFGLPEDGLVDMQAAIVTYRKTRPGAIYLATMLVDAAAALVEIGRFSEAHAYLDEATAIRIHSGLDTHAPIHNFTTGMRIRLALAEGELETASSLLQELFVDADETLGLSLTTTEQSLLAAEIDSAAGRSASAIERTRRVRDKIEENHLSEYLAFYQLRADLIEGRSALQEHVPSVALPLLQRSLSVRERLLAPTSLRIAEGQIALAECYLVLGREAEARSLAAAARNIHAEHPQVGEQYRDPLRRLNQTLRVAQ